MFSAPLDLESRTESNSSLSIQHMVQCPAQGRRITNAEFPGTAYCRGYKKGQDSISVLNYACSRELNVHAIMLQDGPLKHQNVCVESARGALRLGMRARALALRDDGQEEGLTASSFLMFYILCFFFNYKSHM